MFQTLNIALYVGMTELQTDGQETNRQMSFEQTDDPIYYAPKGPFKLRHKNIMSPHSVTMISNFNFSHRNEDKRTFCHEFLDET